MSKIFWFYVKNKSKSHAENYFSVAKNCIKNFGVCYLRNVEKLDLLNFKDIDKIDNFLFEKYDINSELIL
jgi:adenine-specific DNA-methyltransferase